MYPPLYLVPIPITGNRDEIMINASWGLGESIVGGTVTPDTFIVRKSDLAVVQRIIADKQCMTVSAPGGTHEVEIPRFLRNTSSLNDEQVIEMAKLALTLETTMEYPVDVECAYAGGRVVFITVPPHHYTDVASHLLALFTREGLSIVFATPNRSKQKNSRF